MHHAKLLFIAGGCLALAAAAPFGCSAASEDASSGSSVGGNSSGTSNGGNGGGFTNCGQCLDKYTYIPCDAQGNPGASINCDPEVCAPEIGCLPCVPGSNTCVGNTVHTCTDEGQIGTAVEECDPSAGLICNDGACTTECDAAQDSPSNVGCEFWAVDLPNERGFNNAADKPWGVVLSNAGLATAQVTIERNLAGPGEPQQLEVVQTATIPSGALHATHLPQAEITGAAPGQSDPPGPPGTHLSSAAFRISSTAPLVVYQFNVFENESSNDASLLLPRNGLGTQYRVLGFPTANPIAPIPIDNAGIPDRSSVSVVGVSEGTSVTVTAGTTTAGGNAGILPLQPGESTTLTIGPFDVLNISSEGIPGDMTGTIVVASKPVAVFTSGERAISPGVSDPPKPPDWEDDTCCTDHIEEQLFPVTSMGRDFVVTRSPIRSTGGFAEADELRFLGVAEEAQVTTNLPPPMDSFTLQPGQVVDTWTDIDVVVQSTQPIAIGQILVSAGYVDGPPIGDPSLTIFPPVEQYRDNYLFFVPPSWDNNYFVLAAPQETTFQLDGSPLSGCLEVPAGELNGTTYIAHRCQFSQGVHRVTGSDNFGLTVYGYGPVGSYAFSGGAKVEPIYEPPPLK